jgi:hypothetical protein
MSQQHNSQLLRLSFSAQSRHFYIYKHNCSHHRGSTCSKHRGSTCRCSKGKGTRPARGSTRTRTKRKSRTSGLCGRRCGRSEHECRTCRRCRRCSRSERGCRICRCCERRGGPKGEAGSCASSSCSCPSLMHAHTHGCHQSPHPACLRTSRQSTLVRSTGRRGPVLDPGSKAYTKLNGPASKREPRTLTQKRHRRQPSTEDAEDTPNAKPPLVLALLAPVLAEAPKAGAAAKDELPPAPNENPALEPVPVLAPNPNAGAAALVVLAPLELPAPALKENGADDTAGTGVMLLLVVAWVSWGAEEPKTLPPPKAKAEAGAVAEALDAPVSADEELVNPKLGAPAAGAASVELEAVALVLDVLFPPKEKPVPAFATRARFTDSTSMAPHVWRARHSAALPCCRCENASVCLFACRCMCHTDTRCHGTSGFWAPGGNVQRCKVPDKLAHSSADPRQQRRDAA